MKYFYEVDNIRKVNREYRLNAWPRYVGTWLLPHPPSRLKPCLGLVESKPVKQENRRPGNFSLRSDRAYSGSGERLCRHHIQDWNSDCVLTLKYRESSKDIFKLDVQRDGVLGTRTRGGRMEGTDESTELWRHPMHHCLRLIRFTRLERLARTVYFFQ